MELSAPTLAGIYEEAVVAVSREMLPTDAFKGSAPGPEQREVEVYAVDDKALLVELLNEIVYLADSDRFACDAALVIAHDDVSLRCKLSGWVSNSAQAQVKAATYHRIKVERNDGNWHARVVLDV